MADAAAQKIRIRMKAYDYKLLDQSAGRLDLGQTTLPRH